MKKFDASGWVRPNIRDLKPYSSARDEFSGADYVFLDANESPFETGLNRYPDPYQEELKERISELKFCRVEQLFLGNGSDEAIDLLFRCFAEPGKDRVLSISPSYGMYNVCAHINGVKLDSVLLKPDFSLDADALIKAVTPETKLIFLCSPNNPSGNLIDELSVRKVLEKFNGLVVIDEAYQDFADGQGFISLLEEFSNLVVLQTFSKAWGMAGVRLGMAMANPQVIAYLNKVKYPYNINRLSQDAVLKAISEKAIVDGRISIIRAERERVIESLSSMAGIEKVFPSEANFVLIKIKNARKVYEEMIDRGIVVRDRSSLILCEDCLRITIGIEEENTQMLEVLSDVILKEIDK